MTDSRCEPRVGCFEGCALGCLTVVALAEAECAETVGFDLPAPRQQRFGNEPE